MGIIIHLRRSKWTAMVASVWIQCTSGSSYCFGIYSPLLKSSQSYDQSTLDSVGFFKDVGANIGVLSGLLYSSFAGGEGPIAVLAAGAFQCFAGYFLMWLSVTGALPRPPSSLMCFYMFLAAHSQTFFNTANVVTAVENFPGSRGTVVGIMKLCASCMSDEKSSCQKKWLPAIRRSWAKQSLNFTNVLSGGTQIYKISLKMGFLGLSGAILIQIYRTLFDENPSSFLLMLALLPTLLPLLLMFFVQALHSNGRDDLKYLNVFSFIVMSLATYLMLSIIGEHFITFQKPIRIFIFSLLLLLLLSPLSLVFKAHSIECSHDEETALIEQNGGRDQTVLPRSESLNLFQAMRTPEFWLLSLVMACAMGSGLATVNNISQIGPSLGYSDGETSTLVSLWSIWNFLGRFGSGYVSDYFLRERGCARPFFIALTLALMSCGHGIISSGLPGSLHLGSVLVGVCYGSQWSLMPTITSELFGIRHFGTIFNTVAIASPVGSYFLSVRVVGYIYDLETSAGMEDCKGAHCFMLSFLIMASVTTVGFLLSVVLFFRTRMFYKQFMLVRSLS